MPRKIDPSKIKTGSGLTPNDSIESNAFVDSDPEMGLESLKAHVSDPIDAHDASAISVDGIPVGTYDSDNVEGVLDELGGLVPPRPPTLGNQKSYMTFTGVTDWGVLKLADAGLTERGILSALGNVDSAIYPYFHYAPKTGWVGAATPTGNDLQSDSMFNVFDGSYTGGGAGKTHSGGYSARSNSITMESFNLYQDPSTAQTVIVSGSLYPADRGTLAIFYVPAQTDNTTDWTTVQCMAALNCGQGILDGCDGLRGGIWNYSINDDVFEYPAAATGQYDLKEIHTGLVRGSNVTIGVIVPYGVNLAVCATTTAHNFKVGDILYMQGTNSQDSNGDSLDGVRTVIEVVTFNTFVVAPSTPPIVSNGNAGSVAKSLLPLSIYNPASADNTAGQVREECTILGGTTSSVAPTAPYVDNRHDENFFRYRMPYLEEYTSLQWIPEDEQFRYYQKPPVSDSPSTNLTKAGNYDNFKKDYWTYQVARYRHRFSLPLAGPEAEQGSLLILHFKKEMYFEELLLEATPPTSDKLYSANMVDTNSIEDITNIVEETQGSYTPSKAYHIVRSRIFEDDAGVVDPSIITAEYTLQSTSDTVMVISGVRYFKPNYNDPTPLSLDVVNFNASSLFENTWRTGRSATSTEITESLEGACPAFLWMGSFGTAIEFTNSLQGLGNYSRKAEINYNLLGSFDLTNPPQAGAAAQFAPADKYILFGDGEAPRFCSDAKLRVFFRRPLRHNNTNYVSGGNFTEVGQSNETLLIHSTNGVAYTDNKNASSSETALKDVEERFLDETYRWIVSYSGASPYTNSETARIYGPGLSSTGVIDIPVRVRGDTRAFTNGQGRVSSFLWNDKNLTALDTHEAQVAGLPDRNPPLSDGVADPMPSRGILMYPQKNYNTGYRPKNSSDITATQPDYTGYIGDRSYIRAFDAAFSRDANPLTEAIGSSFFKLRIHGLKLADFEWDGGFDVGNAAIAILVKLAGLTTWLDIGRPDGSGPSKQDAFNDGAGCQIVDPTETLEARDPVTGIWYSDVLIHLGPSVTLYDNGLGEAPVLVKVIIKDSVGGKNLNFEQGGANGTTDALRGLVGIELRRPE